MKRLTIKGKSGKKLSCRRIRGGVETPIAEMTVCYEKETLPFFDMHLENTHKVIIKIDNYDGVLKDISTGKEYSKPFVFEPGKYHLQTIPQ